MAMHDSSSEKSIFYAAIDLADPASRCTYLDVACNGDVALRQRIETLLKAAEHNGSFLRRRAVDCIAIKDQHGRDFNDVASENTPEAGGEKTQSQRSASTAGDSESDSLIGQTLSHYRIVSLIGSGGMGRVYLAEDQKLGRRIALKLVASRWKGEGHARFLREAQLAAAIDHPNVCAIYDVDEASDKCFIAMQYVQGQTLEQLIDGRPLAVDTVLAIALQVADALSAAHRRGIVHRDIKSRNIMVTSAGQAIVLDFGLAKLFAPNSPDAALVDGMVGTPAFMSPEQARGKEVDCRSDIFSFGAVLYHMATGTTPFGGASSTEVMRSLAAEPHTPARSRNSKIPRKLADVIDRALCKAPQDRYQSVEDMASELRSIQSQLSLVKHPASVRARKQHRTIATVVAASLLMAFGWIAWQSANVSWARKQVPVIANLARTGQSLDAYDLAVRVRKYVPDDRALNRIMIAISDSLTVTSEPAGARVYLKRFTPGPTGESPSLKLVDTTPISNLEVARGSYVVRVEKKGYEPFQRTWFNAVSGSPELPIQPLPSIQIDTVLTPAGKAPDGMVLVPGREYRLAMWVQRPSDDKVKLDDYFIDKFEVSNRQFKEFVDAGGYQNPSFWTHPIVKDGRTIPREEAMRELVDRTSKPGPRHWSGGTYPKGKADHPVTNITWYEAAAYAAFRGKSLPTIFQWEMAARHGASSNSLGVTMPWGMHNESTAGRANFASSGTIPVGSLEFGMSPFGCYDMAGNVAEWCLNETEQGFIARGGSWASREYEFATYGPYPRFFQSDYLGFRCVLNAAGATGDQGAMWIDLDDEVPQLNPAPEAEVKKFFAHYEYDREPLNAQVEVAETDEWRRERIAYHGADGERALAYLYLPKHFPAPHQLIHLFPAGDVHGRFRTVPESIEADYASFIRSGRAVFAVVLGGYLEREQELPAWSARLDETSIEYVDAHASTIIDMRRGLDYLETRDDVDSDGIAFLGASFAGPMMVLPAIESRYDAVILANAGIQNVVEHPAASAVNFAPLIKPPKLHVRGRYDECLPLTSAAEPLFSLLTGTKKKFDYDGGHRPDPEDLARVVNAWLDETLGPVKQPQDRDLSVASP
jgi:serine/threonine protein kinase/formylglycine-generating enzyme required for sulfatase activity